MIRQQASSFDALYHQLVAAVDNYGTSFTTRGFECIEARPASFAITEPQFGLYTGRSRRLSYRFFALETLGYLAGLPLHGGDRWFVDLLCSANKGFRNFVNPATGINDGAYGPRLIGQYLDVIDKLKDDPNSRQGVLSIWSNKEKRDTVDLPCTTMLHVYNTAESDCGPSLGMSVYMRSNDLNWGTPYDVAAFCAIQMVIAAELGWTVGEYNHFAGSLHYYVGEKNTEQKPYMPRILPKNEEVFYPITIPTLGYDDDGIPWYGERNFERSSLDAELFLKDVHTEIKSGVRFKDIDLTARWPQFFRWNSLINMRWMDEGEGDLIMPDGTSVKDYQ